MRNIALCLIVALTSACAVQVSGHQGATEVVSTILNGVTLTFLNNDEYTDSIVVTSRTERPWTDNPYESVRKYRLRSGWSEVVNGQVTNQTVTVLARAFCRGKFIGSATQGFDVFNQRTDQVVWQIGGAYNSAGTARYSYSTIIPSDRKVCRH